MQLNVASDIQCLVDKFGVTPEQAQVMIDRGFRVDIMKSGAEDIITTSSGIPGKLDAVVENLRKVAAECQQGVD